MSTLKNVIEKLKDIGNSNPIYNQVGDGQIWEVDGNSDIKYPLMWYDYETTPHLINNQTVTLNMDIWFVDLVFDDESNELQIKSDTLESAIDFVKFIKENYDSLDFYVKDGNWSALSFSEKWNDKVSGCKLSLEITLKGAGSSCSNIFKL